ncbi:MAG: sigma-54-dependent Fis family transcriptional regulator [Nitrospirota bacterium]|nr:sigma-54-dependent Fis family transcriptional regulator [Nitrospirota bacterium]
MKAVILVVDDEESIRYTFENFLSEAGHDVVTAAEFDEALAKIRERNFDLIYTDIILGGKSGLDLLHEVRNRNITCPVVVITGFPNIDTATDAVRLGAFDYIFKPVRQENLIHTTNLALQHKFLYDEKENYRSNLEAIFRSVKDAIITVNKELKVLEVNEAARKICGIGRDLIGMSVETLPKLCSSRCIDAVRKTINERRAVELYRIECEYKGQHTQVVSVSTSPLLSSKDEFFGAVIVVKDETRLSQLERNFGERRQFHNIMGQSKSMQHIYSLIEDLADVQTTVLITGESGTGKELVAEAIHYKGNRSSRPLVKVNCASLSEGILESELFGHVKGAFTGADRDKTGRFQKADSGTIFLDEIGDISPRMQLRLLRVLQEKEFERVGDSTPIRVDIRIITATNQDLSERVKRGDFREDLYYRLKVMEIALPPLRERKDDIPLLTDYFLQKFNNKFNKEVKALSDDVMKIFMDHTWPGNVRELEHTLEHAFVTARQDIITVDQLPSNLTPKKISASTDDTEAQLGPEHLLNALNKTGWNKSKAARMLGINVRTIYRKIEKYNLQTEEKT